MFKTRIFAEWALFAALLCACQPDNQGTELPNEVTGVLYLPGGAPAADAAVTLYPVDYLPGKTHSATATVQTDGAGRFTFAGVTSGQYNLLARASNPAFTSGISDSLFGFSDSLSVSGEGLNLPADTLGQPGSLTGRLQLQPGDDPRTVTLYVLGTDNFTVSDSAGNFTLKYMARGTYWVRFLSTLDSYSPLDLPLTIVSGVQGTLPNPIVLPFRGIPVLQGLTVQYDTLLQIAALSWKPADTALISGYNVYRREGDSNYVRLNSVLIRDTSYLDSLMLQDDAYEFNVKIVDKNGNEGSFQNGARLQAVGIYAAIDSIPAGNATALFYDGGSQLFSTEPDSAGETRITVRDTSLAVLRTFDLDSVLIVRGVDRSGRIWARAQTTDSLLRSEEVVKVFAANGAVVGALPGGPNPAQAPSQLNVVAAKSTGIFAAYPSGPDGSYQIAVYNNGLQYVRTFPGGSIAYTFNGLNTKLFDANNNGNLALFGNGSVSVYDTSGTLSLQRKLPYEDVEGFSSVSTNTYLIYHCERGCYYDITSSQFIRKAIFLGRLDNGSTLSALGDGFGRLFVLENSGVIKVYAPRRPFF